MKDFEDVNLEVKAYADSRGNKIYNEKLAKRRANNVVKLLINAGIKRERILDVAMGEAAVSNSCVDGTDC